MTGDSHRLLPLSLPNPENPTMPKLLEFHVPHEVGTHYYDFGTHLLQDATGETIASIEHQYNKNCKVINQIILRRWLGGAGEKPKTWATLLSVLNKSGKGELAETIRKFLLDQQN